MEAFGFEKRCEHDFPLFLATVPAGFPSPADDYIDRKLDLNEYLVTHPAATFFVRVYGDSMVDANITTGDILIVDRAIEPTSGRIVIAILDGELTVKRLLKKNGRLFLVPENSLFSRVEITPELDFEIWGVVTYIIYKA
nr:translesion error-prone DNA polymerase V autoproteolytic subunit [Desulfovibrio inopinatus]